MNALIDPLLRQPAKHLYRLIRDPRYREYCLLRTRLDGKPRYTACSANIGQNSLEIPDAASFLSAFKDIFVENIYLFKADVPNPKILDLGANIGLGVLFFKTLYPESEIVALEADPKIFDYLVRNIHGNGYRDVQLVNKAAWDKSAVLKFMPEGADGGRIGAADGAGNSIEVEAVDALGLIENRRIDFLKMDIEGAEVEVLVRCRNALSGVRRIFVEYHSKADGNQDLSQLLEVFESAGFRYYIRPAASNYRPFVERRITSGYDMMLNIFAWRSAD